MILPLLCTVRNCREPLAREEGRVVCPRGHSFDVARTGYINLLQPQDRRSPNPGDTARAVAARRAFFDSGVTKPLVDEIVGLLDPDTTASVLDAGCGEGHHLAAICERFGSSGSGVDISVPAIEAAARRHPDPSWIVANADRFIPYADATFTAVTSITARMNSDEFRRVLRADGVLLVAIPAPDDLLELREAILGERVLRDRVDRTIDTFSAKFSLQRQERIRHVARLDRDAIESVMTSTYRGLRHSEREKLDSSGPLDVTLSRDVLLFRPV